MRSCSVRTIHDPVTLVPLPDKAIASATGPETPGAPTWKCAPVIVVDSPETVMS